MSNSAVLGLLCSLCLLGCAPHPIYNIKFRSARLALDTVAMLCCWVARHVFKIQQTYETKLVGKLGHLPRYCNLKVLHHEG